MSVFKVVTTKRFAKSDIEYIKSELPFASIIVPPEFDSDSILKAISGGVDVFLGPPPARVVLEASQKTLRLVQIPWAGVDGIDFSNCRRLEAMCANSHGNCLVVAEMALALLLSAAKSIPRHDSDLREGEWHRPGSSNGFFPPLQLSGRTIGYYGFGAINQSLDRMLAGFDVEKLACVKHPRRIEGIDSVYGADGFYEFLEASDYIIAAAPLTIENKGIFDSKAFSSMKNSACFVNVSRHDLVNERALYNALINGDIACAGSDVWSGGPPAHSGPVPVSAYPFHELKNIVVSPHRAGFSFGELPHLSDAIDNIVKVYKYEPVSNIIDYNRGY